MKKPLLLTIIRRFIGIAGFFLFLFCAKLSYSQFPWVKQWDARFGGTGDDYLFIFQQTADSGYILGGWSVTKLISGDKTEPTWDTSSSYAYRGDYWVVKIDSVGNKQWDKRFGGILVDRLYSLQQTSDGGYILGGFSNSPVSGDKTQGNWDPTLATNDYWIVKIDAAGNKQWDRTFGGTADDKLLTVQQTADGGFALGGWSRSGIGGDKTQASRGSYDYWIIKTDALGNMQWDRRFGGIDADVFSSLQQTNDGGYILGGYSFSTISGDKTQNVVGGADYWIVKLDALGNKIWDKQFGGTADDELFYVNQTSDKGYILGGWSTSGIGGDKTQSSQGNMDYWVVKADSLGNKIWDKDYGGNLAEDEFGNVIQTNDGGYIASGNTYSPASGDKTEANLGYEQSWIVKSDSLGNKIWDKTIFTTGHDEYAMTIQTNDGCYAIAVQTNADIGGYKSQDGWSSTFDYWIVKFCDTTHCAVTANFISLDSTGFCDEGGRCIDFTDQSTCNPTSWKWLFSGAVPDTSTQQNPTNICYYIPGSYSVTLIASNSVSSDTLKISPFVIFASGAALPVITYRNDTLFCSHASTYQWYFNGSPIPGATDSFYVAPLCGFYSVFITDSNGCSRLANSVLGGGCAVNELSAQAIQIFPNPVGESLVISHSSLLNGTLSIYNVLGEKVYSHFYELQTTNSELKIDVSAWAKGVYIVQVNDGDKVFRAKFVRQ